MCTCALESLKAYFMTIKICIMVYVIALIRICCNIKLQLQAIQLKINYLFLSVMPIKKNSVKN